MSYILFCLRRRKRRRPRILRRGCGSMDFRRRYRRFLTGLLLASLLGLGAFHYMEVRDQIPDTYTQTQGDQKPSGPGFFVTEEIGPGVAEASVNAYAPESYTISYKYLGIFPLKESRVEVLKPSYVIPGGIPIGIYMETNGILIVGTGKVTGMDGLNYEPALRIVQGGDYIRAVNGEEIWDKEELIERINQAGDSQIVLDLMRKGERIQVKLEPVQTGQEEYKLGIWVRDNTQGIGTLTFLTEGGEFGALGHGINDVDTGTMLKLHKGSLYDTNIVDIKRGEKGTPGELSGMIRYRNELVCGEICENTPAGIFGTGSERLYEKISLEKMQVGYKQEIETGEAWIRSSVSGRMRDYRVEILEVNRNEADVNKGIILRVTDPELLDLTGGIVQGMSGSPILQHGKIVGAVTHVFVQDSTKGFGVFIENMLEHVDS